MSLENYYIAYYKAILDRNISKIDELEQWFDNQKDQPIEYQNENHNLKYEDVFADQNPEKVISDFIYFTLETDQDFALKMEMQERTETSEKDIITRRENYKKLLEYPLLNHCPNPALGINILDTMASITYSTMFNRHDLTKLANLVHNSPILADVLMVISTHISNRNEQKSIALIGENVEDYDPTQKDINGYNSIALNQIVVTNQDEVNFPIILHEIAHFIMFVLFDNPAPYNSEEIKDKYHHAIKDTLLNIHSAAENYFALNIDLNIDEKSTWEMGQDLFYSFFLPEAKTEETEHEIISKNSARIENIDAELIKLYKIATIFAPLYCDDEDVEDYEFIARLPEIIAAGLHTGEISNILSPLAIFWEDNITPSIVDYLESVNPNGICLPLIETEGYY